MVGVFLNGSHHTFVPSKGVHKTLMPKGTNCFSPLVLSLGVIIENEDPQPITWHRSSSSFPREQSSSGTHELSRTGYTAVGFPKRAPYGASCASPLKLKRSTRTVCTAQAVLANPAGTFLQMGRIVSLHAMCNHTDSSALLYRQKFGRRWTKRLA